MAGGGWRVAGGGWRVAGGGWRVAGGGWRVADGWFLVAPGSWLLARMLQQDFLLVSLMIQEMESAEPSYILLVSNAIIMGPRMFNRVMRTIVCLNESQTLSNWSIGECEQTLSKVSITHQ